MSLTVEQANEILGERYEFFMSHINAGDIDPIVFDYYTENAYATGHETPLTRGADALKQLFEEIHSEFKNVSIEMADTRVAGDDCIYSLVTASSTMQSVGQPAEIKSLLVFRKQDDKWRCDADIFAMGGF